MIERLEMSKCKKCGANLRKTNKVFSVVENSEASKNLSKGDVVVSVDEKNVKTLADIKKEISENKPCKITILNNEQTKTFSVDVPIDYFKSVEFESDTVCSKCGAKQKGNKIFLLIGVILVLIIVSLFGIVLSKNKQQTATIDIEDNSAEFVSDGIGKDSIDMMSDNELTVDFKGRKVSVTSSGALTNIEKSNNIEAINSNLKKTGQNYENLEFEDSELLFSTETIGNDNYRKMYTKNSNFDIRKPSVSGYALNALTQDKLADIGKTNKEILGTIYFDYVYANGPKNAIVKTQKTTLGKIDFNEVRYAETVVALKNLLSEIPQVALNTTIFYLDGHTDHTSSHDFNQTLSEARAECIKEILTKSFGINARNIITRGYSWDCLAINTLDECAENRRVEISVVFFN